MKNLRLDKNQQNAYRHMRDGHWLSSEEHMEQFYLWNTFYRRNLHRFATEYLGLKLHFYQIVILYLMGVSRIIVIIASRAAAKSFVIAVYACCKAILYPGSIVVLTSGTKGQAGLIVRSKIKKELWNASPNLRREIKKITDNSNEAEAEFKNGSLIVTVTLNPGSRGNRSHGNVAEEAREINKSVYDEVVTPFLIVRQAPYMTIEEYSKNPILRENPPEIYISSSIEESHWLYGLAKDAMEGTLRDDGQFFIAFDYAITLKHNIKTRQQLEDAKRKTDPITWMIEYENRVLRSNSRAYFTYELMKENQTLLKAFYPKRPEDVSGGKTKNMSVPKKLPGEVRVISCDIAAIDRSGNDNSCFSCLRLFEESTISPDGRISKEYRVQVPYIEAMRGQETKRQAIRIRQLYDDFDADYITLDGRNLGVSVYDALARLLYDDQRGLEYQPFKAMNDDAFANRIISSNAEPKIFIILATANLNSSIAVNLKSMLLEHKLDLLVPEQDGIAEISKYIPDLNDMDPDTQLFYEKPYYETMLAVNEMINLVYEKKQATGLISISEVGTNTKDRYTSISYGCYFASQLARDLLNHSDMYDWNDAPTCVSAVDF